MSESACCQDRWTFDSRSEPVKSPISRCKYEFTGVFRGLLTTWWRYPQLCMGSGLVFGFLAKLCHETENFGDYVDFFNPEFCLKPSAG